MGISRRSFLGTAALTGIAGSTMNSIEGAATMPTRILGRTGARVSILAFGCGSRLLMYKDAEQGIAALNRALDLGINYLDTAASYGDGKSEEWVGQVMKTRRNGTWLATKIDERKGDQAMRTVEACLKRLQTDHLDLVHVHGLADENDLKAVEAKDGVLNVFYKLRDQKVARFIGVTCHDDPHVLKAALEHNDFDCTQMALNAARVGMTRNSANPLADSFETVALPVALNKKMGVTAMKIFAQEKLLNETSVDNLVRYAMSLPVAAAVIGMPKLDLLEHNVNIARNFKPMPKDEMHRISGELAAQHKASLDQFFHNHVDC